MTSKLLAIILLCSLTPLLGQDNIILLNESQIDPWSSNQVVDMDGWLFKEGHNSTWKDPDLDTRDWKDMKPTELRNSMANEEGRVEGWFRIKFRIDKSLENIELGVARELWAATEIYLDGQLVESFGNAGTDRSSFEPYNPVLKYSMLLDIKDNHVHTLAMRFVMYEDAFTPRDYRLREINLVSLLKIVDRPAYNRMIDSKTKENYIFNSVWITITLLLVILFWLIVLQDKNEKTFKLVATVSSLILLMILSYNFARMFELSFTQEKIRFIIFGFLGAATTVVNLMVIEVMLSNKVSKLSIGLLVLMPIASDVGHLYNISWPFGILNTILQAYFIYLVFRFRKSITRTQWSVIASMVLIVLSAIVFVMVNKYSPQTFHRYESIIFSCFVVAQLFLLLFVANRFREIMQEVRNKAARLLQMSEEKKKLLADQNILLEEKVERRTSELNKSLEDLKSTQTQLIHSEKMASLGELTAGIAHEIQNPLNFVNNFSDVNNELLDELKEELKNGNLTEVEAIANDLKDNESKITHHGKRAEEIVKSMLQHSRGGDGKNEPTDINALCDEYLRLAYHGLRAKDKSFNADFELDLDPNLTSIEVVPQDIGRVLLNLINNAFQAVSQKAEARLPAGQAGSEDYSPKVTVTTKSVFPSSGGGDQGEVSPLEGGVRGVLITVSDNGPGIPDEIKDKIFQPFFTTKPTGEGTGLGLSMSYDIVTKGHGGKLEVESEEGKGTTFIVQLTLMK